MRKIRVYTFAANWAWFLGRCGAVVVDCKQRILFKRREGVPKLGSIGSGSSGKGVRIRGYVVAHL